MNVITCTDGSLYASSVHQHGAWAATRLQTRVTLLHVLDPHRELAQGNDHTGAIGFNASAELTEELVKLEAAQARVARLKGTALLDDATKQFAAAGINSVETLQRHGTLVETLTDLEPTSSLVVIGKCGVHADLPKGHVGSQVERVIRGSARPVLVAARDYKSIDRFLIAYDGGPSIRKALEFIYQSPLLKGLPCHLLRAGRIDDTARYYLYETADKLRLAGFDVTAQAHAGNPESVISDYVRNQSIDLLVMGAYGHSTLRQFILGSTTTTVIRSCDVPVLMFR